MPDPTGTHAFFLGVAILIAILLVVVPAGIAFWLGAPLWGILTSGGIPLAIVLWWFFLY